MAAVWSSAGMEELDTWTLTPYFFVTEPEGREDSVLVKR